MAYQYAVIDIETTGLNRFKHDITWIGVGLAKDIDSPLSKVYLIPFAEDYEKAKAKFLELFEKIQAHRLKVVLQNGKFDTLFIEYRLGIKLPISEDTMVLGTAYDMAAKHDLKGMAVRYLKVPNWDIPKKKKLSATDPDVRPYLHCDVKYTWGVFQHLMTVTDERKLKQYRKILLPAYRTYRDVERTGIYIDLKKYKLIKEQFSKEAEEKLALLKARYDINWNSAPQIAEAMFEKEGLPILKKSKKTGKPSADKKVMNRLAAKGHELPKMLLAYKDLDTANKMSLKRWQGDIAPDGRIHPSFGLTNVRTGRTSCKEPNLQQVPRRKEIRGLFTATPGYKFFEADYSQLELRIAADYSKDPTMINIYRKGGDIHTETARLMTNGRDPTKDERNKAKAVNFGFLYGMLARKFVDYAFDSYRTVFTLPEAERFREAFFSKYFRLLEWHKEMEMQCEMLGGVANRFGRFRKLPDIYSQDRFERLGAARKAINTPVQGTGSDLLISAATQLHKLYGKSGLRIVGTVHDSILGEFPEDEEEFYVAEIKRVMSHPQIMDDFAVSFRVPLEADVGVGPWGSK